MRVLESLRTRRGSDCLCGRGRQPPPRAVGWGMVGEVWGGWREGLGRRRPYEGGWLSAAEAAVGGEGVLGGGTLLWHGEEAGVSFAVAQTVLS